MGTPDGSNDVDWNDVDEDQGSAVDRRRLDLRARLLDAAGLRDIPAPEPLVDGWLFRDSLSWLSGKPGNGKSFVAVDLACCVATGADWHGQKVAAGKVLYLIAEGASGIGQRVDAWAVANGRQVERILFLPVPVQLLDAIDGQAFELLLDELAPDFLVIDTQARVTVGLEENSSKDMGRFVDVLETLRRASGACVMVVHHEARGGENLRGSTALEGAATTILRATKDGALVTLTNTKQKDAPEQDELPLFLAPVLSSAVLSHEVGETARLMSGAETTILTALRESFDTDGASSSRLMDAASLPKASFYRALRSLTDKGLVRKKVDGRHPIYLVAADDIEQHIPSQSQSLSESHDGPRDREEATVSRSHHLYIGETAETPPVEDVA